MKKLKFGFTGTSTKITTFSTMLGQWWYILFAALGSASVSIATSSISNYNWTNEYAKVGGLLTLVKFLSINPWSYLVAGISAIFYGGKGTFDDLDNLNTLNKLLEIENGNVSKLKQKIDSISEDSESLQEQLSERHTKLVITWLKSSYKQLNLNTYDRATIYYYIDEHFYLLARYSKNPEYDKVHRQKFTTKYGVISQAWQHKDCIDTTHCPEYSKDPQGYIDYMEKNYGYNKNKIEKLQMKSCEFVALSISASDTHIGVIVFESILGNRFKQQKIREINKYCKEYQSYMCDFIKDGIKLDKSAKVASSRTLNTDKDFLSQFTEEDR